MRNVLIWGVLLAMLASGCRPAEPSAAPPGATQETPLQEAPAGEPPLATQPGVEVPPLPANPKGAPTQPAAAAASATQVRLPPIETLPLPPPYIIDAALTPAFPPGSTVIHKVSRGEWLRQIARCYGAVYADVLKVNNLENPNRLSQGMRLTIPAVGSQGPVYGPPCVQLYKVQKDDTWQALAQRFNTHARILQAANPGPLVAGQKITVPAEHIASGAPPKISHDLLFIYAGDLAIWQADSGQVLLYPDPAAKIVDLATNQAGKMILVKQTRDGGATYEMALVDRQAGVVRILEGGLQHGASDPRKEQILVSPDGGWAVYLAAHDGSLHLASVLTASGMHLSGPDLAHGRDEVIAPQLFAGTQPEVFLLLDEAGIFQYPYSLGGKAQQLYAMQPAKDSPWALRAVGWAPFQWYLLLEGGFIEGSAYFVFDQRGETLSQLPNSGSYTTVSAAGWVEHPSLLVLSPPLSPAAQGPQATFYSVDGQTPALESVALALPVLGETPPGETPMGYALALPAAQPDPASALFSLQGASPASDGLYRLEVTSQNVRRLNSMPAPYFLNTWLRDGSGVLAQTYGIEGAPGNVVYVPTDGKPPFSLVSWLGEKISDFYWIEP
jgi:LysM repeat protein